MNFFRDNVMNRSLLSFSLSAGLFLVHSPARGTEPDRLFPAVPGWTLTVEATSGTRVVLVAIEPSPEPKGTSAHTGKA